MKFKQLLTIAITMITLSSPVGAKSMSVKEENKEEAAEALAQIFEDESYTEFSWGEDEESPALSLINNIRGIIRGAICSAESTCQQGCSQRSLETGLRGREFREFYQSCRDDCSEAYGDFTQMCLDTLPGIAQ